MIDITRQGVITRVDDVEIAALKESAGSQGVFLFMKSNTSDSNIYTIIGDNIKTIYNSQISSDDANNIILAKTGGNVIIGDSAIGLAKLHIVGNQIVTGNINSNQLIPQNTNITIGANAGLYVNTGNGNVIIGYNGAAASVNKNLTSSNNSVYIGANTSASSDIVSNEIVIGAYGYGRGSNSVSIGNNNTIGTYLFGNVSIGSNGSSNNLYVSGAGSFISITAYNQATLNMVTVNGNTYLKGRIYDYTNNYGNNKILSSNANGNLIWKSKSDLNLIDGAGSANYIPKFTSGGTSGSTVGNSVIYQNGINIGINTLTPITLLDVKLATNQHVQFSANTYGNYSGAPGVIALNDAGTAYTPLGFYASKYFFGNGNMGIGTISPNAKLHTIGDAIFTGNINAKYIISSNINNNSIGVNSLSALVTGSNNTLFGTSTARYLVSGSNNLIMGNLAGAYASDNSNKVYADSSIYLGGETKSLISGSTTNEIVIGYGASGYGNNTITLGKYNTIDCTHLNGNMIVSVKNPAESDPDDWFIAPYDISGSNGHTFRCRFTNVLNFNVGDEFVMVYHDDTYTKEFTFNSKIASIIDGYTFTTIDPVPTNFAETTPGGYVIKNTAITAITTSMSGNTNTDNAIIINCNILPAQTNFYNLGSASNIWGNIYAHNSPIVTSDSRLKTTVENFTTDEINASIQLSKEIGTFKFLSAIREKGELNARKHIGLTVQKAIEIMRANNLNPFEYGFICYDTWDSGDAYSLRYDELLMFISRGFEERLTKLENNI